MGKIQPKRLSRAERKRLRTQSPPSSVKAVTASDTRRSHADHAGPKLKVLDLRKKFDDMVRSYRALHPDGNVRGHLDDLAYDVELYTRMRFDRGAVPLLWHRLGGKHTHCESLRPKQQRG